MKKQILLLLSILTVIPIAGYTMGSQSNQISQGRTFEQRKDRVRFAREVPLTPFADPLTSTPRGYLKEILDPKTFASVKQQRRLAVHRFDSEMPSHKRDAHNGRSIFSYVFSSLQKKRQSCEIAQDQFGLIGRLNAETGFMIAREMQVAPLSSEASQFLNDQMKFSEAVASIIVRYLDQQSGSDLSLLEMMGDYVLKLAFSINQYVSTLGKCTYYKCYKSESIGKIDAMEAVIDHSGLLDDLSSNLFKAATGKSLIHYTKEQLIHFSTAIVQGRFISSDQMLARLIADFLIEITRTRLDYTTGVREGLWAVSEYLGETTFTSPIGKRLLERMAESSQLAEQAMPVLQGLRKLRKSELMAQRKHNPTPRGLNDNSHDNEMGRTSYFAASESLQIERDGELAKQAGSDLEKSSPLQTEAFQEDLESEGAVSVQRGFHVSKIEDISNIQDIPIREILKKDGNTPRPTQVAINPESVRKYMVKMKQGEEIAPIVVMRTPQVDYLIKGHHRYIAGQILNKELPLSIIVGGGPSEVPQWEDVNWVELNQR